MISLPFLWREKVGTPSSAYRRRRGYEIPCTFLSRPDGLSRPCFPFPVVFDLCSHSLQSARCGAEAALAEGKQMPSAMTLLARLAPRPAPPRAACGVVAGSALPLTPPRRLTPWVSRAFEWAVGRSTRTGYRLTCPHCRTRDTFVARTATRQTDAPATGPVSGTEGR